LKSFSHEFTDTLLVCLGLLYTELSKLKTIRATSSCTSTGEQHQESAAPPPTKRHRTLFGHYRNNQALQGLLVLLIIHVAGLELGRKHTV